MAVIRGAALLHDDGRPAVGVLVEAVEMVGPSQTLPGTPIVRALNEVQAMTFPIGSVSVERVPVEVGEGEELGVMSMLVGPGDVYGHGLPPDVIE